MKLHRFSYLFSLILVFTVPLMVEWYFLWNSIDKFSLVTFVIGIVVLGSLWDISATKHGKRDPLWLWKFNDKDTLGIKFFDLPIEEYLFYVVTSLYIIFTWKSIELISQTGNLMLLTVLPSLALWSLLFIALPYFIGKRYRDKCW